MLLTSIKLSGFKSFVDPTNVLVQGRLVGVVGPNGCGKSNVIDAVRWVLGESRASELRGESMQDVIFNGTSSRKSAGRASVELVFDNSEGRASGQWSQYAEISVRRTLTRDGSSIYYINNQAVRRRDIQDIFLGTGLGPRAYAIVGQGMITRLIEARPDELRVFLEEAAGVSRYKERRRETENRLHDTRENLQRVEDILQELEGNLSKLERQAEVARRFHELQAEQDEKQKLLWLMRKDEAEAERNRILRDTERAQNDLEARTATLRQKEAELETMRQSHYDANNKLHEAQGKLYETNSEIGSLEAKIRFVIESRTRMQAQIAALTQQQEQWQRQGSQHQEALSEAQQRLETLTTEQAQAQDALLAQSEVMPQFEQALREAQQNATGHREAVMQVQQQIELASAHHRNAANVLGTLTTRRERLARESDAIQAPDTTELSQLGEQLVQAQAGLVETQQLVEQARSQRSELEDRRRNAQSQFESENAALAQVRAQLSALKQLQQNVQTKGKVQPWLAKHELDGLPRLWKKLQIESGWERALEAVLRERMSALEVSRLDWAKAFFNDAPPARLAFFAPGAQEVAPAGEAPEELEPLFGLLTLEEPGLVAALQEWLHGVFVVEDTAAAFAARDQLPPAACFVTQDGHLIDRASVRFYAPDSEQDGMMQRQREIDDLERRQVTQQQRVDEARAALSQEDAQLAQTVKQLQEGHQTVQRLTESVHNLQMRQMKLNELQQRFEQRSTQIGSEQAEIAEQEVLRRKEMADAEQQMEALDADLAKTQGEYEARKTILLEKEQQLNTARQALRDNERAVHESEFMLRSQRSRIEELTRNIATARQQAEKLQLEMKQGDLELEGLDDKVAQADLQDLLTQRTDQERVLAEARNKVEHCAQQLRELEEARLTAERNLLPQRDKIVELQLKEQAARINQDQYAQQLLEAEADEAALKQKLKPEMKTSWLQGEVTRLNNAIGGLGAVNLAALEELASASERKQFLDEQETDLTTAVNTLEDAIRRIDRETRELLQNTFDEVNRHFGEIFPTLFGGGQARLNMTGDEILDSGVQVMAQPPGKKNSTIHLLSGGEKALTAIALVFAMFQLNPAPFCLLDEVDAPLDDANTERYCSMVKKMSAKTQFLFISHNKLAMEMAQQLVGVTMQEQGVSRVVAVGLESAIDFASEVQAA